MLGKLLAVVAAIAVVAFGVAVYNHRDNPPTGNGLPINPVSADRR